MGSKRGQRTIVARKLCLQSFWQSMHVSLYWTLCRSFWKIARSFTFLGLGISDHPASSRLRHSQGCPRSGSPLYSEEYPGTVWQRSWTGCGSTDSFRAGAAVTSAIFPVKLNIILFLFFHIFRALIKFRISSCVINKYLLKVHGFYSRGMFGKESMSTLLSPPFAVAVFAVYIICLHLGEFLCRESKLFRFRKLRCFTKRIHSIVLLFADERIPTFFVSGTILYMANSQNEVCALQATRILR